MLKKLPIDISDFAELRTKNYLYIDKTKIIYDLIMRKKQYFLSRPRRFGKSLLITTLRELFAGNKELFKGLWIAEQSDYKWTEHPVIHLDFSPFRSQSEAVFSEDLCARLDKIADIYGINRPKGSGPEPKIVNLVEELARKAPVAILIDEYDAPLLDNINNEMTFTEIHKTMRTFFRAIKSVDALLRAVFLTGVAKFSRTSIFSGMNNLTDISLDPMAAHLLGYTKDEIDHSLLPYLNVLAEHKNEPIDALINQVTIYYNGYRFCQDSIPKVYNPYSFLHFLESGTLKNYWFTSGTPSFLITLLSRQSVPLLNLKDLRIHEADLESFDITNLPFEAMLFQAGYLTITSYNPETEDYTLNYPNREIQKSFEEYLVSFTTRRSISQVLHELHELRSNLEQHKFDDFFKAIQSFVASIPNNLLGKEEKYYHSLFILLLRMLSFTKYSELLTDKGRIDTVIETPKEVFIFELKINKTPQEAIKQIEEKKYYERYLLSRKKITLIGVNFDRTQSGIVIEHVVKEL